MSLNYFDDEIFWTINVLILNYFKDKVRYFVLTHHKKLENEIFANQFILSITDTFIIFLLKSECCFQKMYDKIQRIFRLAFYGNWVVR